MQNLSARQTTAKEACIYLRDKCKISCDSSHFKIKTFYEDVLTQFLNQKNPPQQQSLSKNAKFQPIFLSLVQKFQQREQQEFLCSKKFQTNKLSSAFKCYQCSLQQNSICCFQCFNFAKHKGHHYQLIEIKGGFCDCGDDSKWDVGGFCPKHTITDQLDETQSELQRQFFYSFCEHAFTILCRLYSAYKSKELQIVKLTFQNSNKMIIQKQRNVAAYILKIVDTFGYNILNSLISINKNRYQINQITRLLLERTLAFPQKLKYVAALPIKEQMLRFSELNLTGKTCVELFMILCNRGQQFKRELTISYCKLYSQIQTYIGSTYSDFSPQLFSSSNMVLELISNKEIRPLTYRAFLTRSSKDKNLQDEIKSLNDDYKHFFKDIQYLIELKEQSFKVYWKQFSYLQGFQSMATFEETFNQSQQCLNLAHKHSFFLQELAFTNVIKIIDKMEGDGDEQFILISLKRLTLKLFQRYFGHQRKNLMENSLFFTSQRMWALFLFAYFHCLKHKKSYNIQNQEGIHELLKQLFASKIGPAEINERLANFKADISSFTQLTRLIMKQLLKKFFHMSHIMKDNALIRQNMSFASTYYKSKNLLYSIDAFLLKFIFVALNITPRSSSKANLNDQEGLNIQTFAIVQEINGYLSILKQQFSSKLIKIKSNLRSQQQRKASMVQIQEIIRFLHNFLHLIAESFYFNYHQLILISNFRNLLKSDKYEENFLTFYVNIWEIWLQKDDKNSLTLFKKSFNYLFFNEVHFFQKFVSTFDQRIVKIRLKKHKQQPMINLEYFYVFRFKFNTSDYLNKFIRKTSFRYIPQNLKNTHGSTIIQQTNYLQIVQAWLAQAIKIQYFHNNIINDLTRQLFKIQVLSRDQAFHQYFAQKFSLLYFQQRLSEKKQSIYSFLNIDLSSDLKNFIQSSSVVQEKNQSQDQNSRSLSFPSNLMEEESVFDRFQKTLQVQHQENQLNRSKAKDNPSFQIYLGIQIDHVCMLGDDCKLKSLHNSQLYQVCFINITNMYGAFQIDKYEKMLAFSTCGHLIHRNCYEKQHKQADYGSIFKCKKCKKNYNFILSSQEYFNSSKDSSKKQLIQEDWTKINKFLKALKDYKSLEFEIFKSIIAFLLSNIIVNDFNLLRKAFILYKNLFKKLKHLVQKYGKQIGYLKQKGIKLPKDSLNTDFIELVSEILAYQFNSQNYQTIDELKISQKYEKSVNYIKQIIQFFKNDKRIWKIQEPSQYLFEQPISKISLQRFPSCLSDLYANRECWNCHSKQQHSYYICLPHASNLKEVNRHCVCFICLHQWVKRHLKEEQKDHLNEALMVRTDTGQIYYFFICPNKKESILMVNITDSIYLNNMMAVYEVGKGYRLADFKISKERERNVVNWLRSWNYLLLVETFELEI